MSMLLKILDRIPVVRMAVGSLRKQLNIYYPRAEARIEKELGMISSALLMVGGATFMALITFEISLYMCIIGAFTAVCVAKLIKLRYICLIQEKLITQLQDFAENILFEYRKNESLEESFWETLLDTGGEMKLHGELIYELMCSGTYEDTYKAYRELAPNEFFLMFYVMSHLAKQNDSFGDDGESLYEKNLTRLVDDIGNRLISIAKSRNEFSGLIAMSILPLFAIKPIEMWALNNLQDMEKYYLTPFGKFCTVFIAIIALVTFTVVGITKYSGLFVMGASASARTESNNRWINRINKMILMKRTKYERLWRKLKQARSSMSVVAFVRLRVTISISSSIVAVIVGINIGLAPFVIVAAALLSGLLGYHWLDIKLRFDVWKKKAEIDSEIIDLYTMTEIMRWQANVDCYIILENLELVAEYYKPLLQEAVDSFNGSGSEVIEQIINNLDNRYLKRLFEGIGASEEISVFNALEFVEAERKYLIKQREVWSLKRLRDKVALAKFVTMLPFAVVIILKLIVPFVMEGIAELELINNSMGMF